MIGVDAVCIETGCRCQNDSPLGAIARLCYDGDRGDPDRPADQGSHQGEPTARRTRIQIRYWRMYDVILSREYFCGGLTETEKHQLFEERALVPGVWDEHAS